MAAGSRGTVHIAIATLTVVAKALAVTIEELLGTATTKVAGKRGSAPKIQQQLEQNRASPRLHAR